MYLCENTKKKLNTYVSLIQTYKHTCLWYNHTHIDCIQFLHIRTSALRIKTHSHVHLLNILMYLSVCRFFEKYTHRIINILSITGIFSHIVVVLTFLQFSLQIPPGPQILFNSFLFLRSNSMRRIFAKLKV